jgi:hypothetical protein
LHVVGGFLLFGIGVFVAAAGVHAGEPLVTDDASVIDPRTCQLESWIRPFHHGHEIGLVPACNVLEGLELSAGGSGVRADGEWSSTLQLQAKTVFVPHDDVRPWSLGASAGAARDTSMPRGGSAFQTYFGRALASLYPTEALEVDLNLGLANSYGSGTYALAGAALQFQPVERAQLLAEIFKDEPGRGGAQVGVRFLAIPNRFELYASYGWRLGSGPADGWATFGIRLQTNAFLP